MPFYRILGEWDEMAPGGDLEMDDDEMRARQQVTAHDERYGATVVRYMII